MESVARLPQVQRGLSELLRLLSWQAIRHIGEIDLDKYWATGRIETVLAGGENYLGSRPLHYEWIKKIYDRCEKYNVHLIFGQTGNVFVKDGREYKIRSRTDQMIQALKSGMHYPPVDIEKEIAKINERKEAFAAMKKRRNKSFYWIENIVSAVFSFNGKTTFVLSWLMMEQNHLNPCYKNPASRKSIPKEISVFCTALHSADKLLLRKSYRMGFLKTREILRRLYQCQVAFCCIQKCKGTPCTALRSLTAF